MLLLNTKIIKNVSKKDLLNQEKKMSYILRKIAFRSVAKYKTTLGILTMHSLRIHDIVDTGLTHLLHNKKAHIRIFSFKTTHLLYMHAILLKTLSWMSSHQNLSISLISMLPFL